MGSYRSNFTFCRQNCNSETRRVGHPCHMESTIDECVWCGTSNGIILTGGNRSTWWETCSSATLSTTNPSLTILGPNPKPCGEKSATSRLAVLRLQGRLELWTCTHFSGLTKLNFGWTYWPWSTYIDLGMHIFPDMLSANLLVLILMCCTSTVRCVNDAYKYTMIEHLT